MKKLIFIPFIILTLFSSCESDEIENDCDPEIVLSKLIAEKEIIVEFDNQYKRNNYSVIDGNKLLFKYYHVGAQCDFISDDEWGEELTFQVEKNSANFEFVDDEILLTNCFYQQFGAWVMHSQYPIKNGMIKGEKISGNEWRITVNIETTPLFQNEPSRKIEFTETFIK